MEIDEVSESLQSYLEVILDLENLQRVARAKDIADRLKIQRTSVTGALKSLEEKGLIHYQPYSFISLTDNGKRVAEEIAHRHRVLKDFLLNVLQVDEKTADTTACRMEHVIDRTTVDRLVCFIEYIHAGPQAGADWLASFIRFCKSGNKPGRECAASAEERPVTKRRTKSRKS